MGRYSYFLVRFWLGNRFITVANLCLVVAGKLMSYPKPLIPQAYVLTQAPAPEECYHPTTFDRMMAAAAEESGFSIVTVGKLGCAVLQPRDHDHKPHA